MKSYFDSSVLVKLYVTEEFSSRARKEAQAVAQLPFTWLHALEVGNALQVLTGRKLLTVTEAHLLLNQVADDRLEHRLAEVALDWPKVFHESVQLSRAHAARLLCRRLDILHVAAAVELSCERFVSADERQLALAKVAGLKTTDIRSVR